MASIELLKQLLTMHGFVQHESISTILTKGKQYIATIWNNGDIVTITHYTPNTGRHLGETTYRDLPSLMAELDRNHPK